MTQVLSFLAAIAILVVIHEFGHYWVARVCGVRVLCFSVGFGKVLFKKRFKGGDTEWIISAIPLGGFVKMLDEREGDVKPEDVQYAFNRKTVWQRMAIVVAGPVANLILAILLYWIIFVHGIQGLKPIIGEVPVGSPAAIAELHKGDVVVSLNDRPVRSWQDLGWGMLYESMSDETVKLVTKNVDGSERTHLLNTHALKNGELEGDYLKKLGLEPKDIFLLPATLHRVAPDGSAALAGLKDGDKILSLNGIQLPTWEKCVEIVRSSPSKPLNMQVQRDAVVLTVTVTPKSTVEQDKTVGKIGAGGKIDQSLLIDVSRQPLEAIPHSFRHVWETSVLTLRILWKMVMGDLSLKNVSGPITMADYAGQSAKAGIISFIGFLSLISISIGVFNLLPIPLLDGGHLLYYAIELIKGSPVPEQAWAIGQKIGLAMLGMLMFLALYNDINRLISG